MTLVEVLISTALFSVVIAGTYMVYTTMQGTLIRGEMKSDLQQNARIGLSRMVSEMRMAGSDPSGAQALVPNHPKAGIRGATAACFAFLAPDPSNRTVQITYSLDGTSLMRREDNWTGSLFNPASAQPVAENVTRFALTYYDTYNKVLAPNMLQPWTTVHTCPPPNFPANMAPFNTVQLTYWQMREVRRVSILLRTQETRPGVFPESFTLATDVRLRNL